MATSVVHHSQTRKKACKACVRSKRRCDLIIPRCGRCSQRDLECTYANTSNGESKPALLPTTAKPSAEQYNATWFVTQECHEHMRKVTPSFDVHGPLSPSSKLTVSTRLEVNSSAFENVAASLRSLISSLAHRSSSILIHPSHIVTSSIPAPLDYALTISALCTLNSPSTLHMLQPRLEALKSSYAVTYSSPEMVLHSVQALVIFQVIRIFSGDERQIFYAETDFPLLNKWTIDLQQAYFSIPPTPHSYQCWILKESIRRTILVSVLLRSYWGISRDGYTEMFPLLCSLPVSLNRHFWDAREEMFEDWQENISRWGVFAHEHCPDHVDYGNETAIQFDHLLFSCGRNKKLSDSSK